MIVWEAQRHRQEPVYAHTTRIAEMRVSVHHYIGYQPGTWLLTALPRFNKEELRATDDEEAKAEALFMIRAWAENMLAERAPTPPKGGRAR